MIKTRIAVFLLCVLSLVGCNSHRNQAAATDKSPATEPLPFPQAIQNALSQEQDTSSYTMELTPQQAASYESGQFILLRHMGGDQYTPFYYSTELTLEGTTLRADFNGKILYVTDSYSYCWPSLATQVQTRGTRVYYTLPFVAGYYEISPSGDQAYVAHQYVLHTVCDRVTGEILHTQILPKDQQPQADVFLGSSPLPELETPECYAFQHDSCYLTVRSDDGALLPMPQWETVSTTTHLQWSGEAGLHLAYGRLTDFSAPYSLQDVYMVFLLKDKMGNSIGSELIPISTLPSPEINSAQPPVKTIQWSTGNRVLLTEQQGVSVYLVKSSEDGNIVYDIQMENTNDFAVNLNATNMLFNDRFWVFGPSFTANPNAWGKGISPIRYPIAAAMGELGQVQRISFHLELSHGTTKKSLAQMDLQVDVSGDAALMPFYSDEKSLNIQEPFMGFLLSEEQLLIEQDGVRISLVKVGTIPDADQFRYLYRVENTTEQWRCFDHTGVDINGTYHRVSNSHNLYPGEIYYASGRINDLLGMEQIGNVRFRFGIGVGKSSDTQAVWCEAIPQAASDAPSTLAEGEHLLLEEKGLRFTLKEQVSDSTGSTIWTLVVNNTTNRDIHIELKDIIADGVLLEKLSVLDVTASNGYVGAHQTTLMDIKSKKAKNVSFCFRILNMEENQLLFITENRLELKEDGLLD